MYSISFLSTVFLKITRIEVYKKSLSKSSAHSWGTKKCFPQNLIWSLHELYTCVINTDCKMKNFFPRTFFCYFKNSCAGSCTRSNCRISFSFFFPPQKPRHVRQGNNEVAARGSGDYKCRSFFFPSPARNETLRDFKNPRMQPLATMLTESLRHAIQKSR